MTTILFKKTTKNNFNTIICEMEPNFTNGISVVVYDDLGDYWKEKTVSNIEEAKKIGKKLFDQALKVYNYDQNT